MIQWRNGDENNTERSVSENRREVLRGMTAIGAAGVLAGCLGTFEQEYEATPGTIPEETATEHGLEPDPEVTERSGRIKQGVGVATIEDDVTGYTTTYEERSEKPPTDQPSEIDSAECHLR